MSMVLVLCSSAIIYYALPQNSVNAIIHKDHGLFKIESLTEATFTETFKATILNAKAKHFAELSEYYDGLSSVKFVTAKVYDSQGDLIYKLKKSDIGDQSNISGISVFEDGRIKWLDLTQQSYPYTIEYEVLKTYQHTFHMPNWYVIPAKNVIVQSSKFEIESPSDMEPRILQKNIADSSFKKNVVDGKSRMTWEFKNVQPVDKSLRSEDALKYLPIINTSPSKFEYDGYQGDFSTWDDFALWIETLNKGRNDLDTTVKKEIERLVADVPNDKDRIKVIYDYLQSNTRYVSIQLGIGGYQPFLASTVYNEGYGDCKALSFYTKSLLEAVGIDSKYVLISAGDDPRPIIREFPQSNFNHAVLCVPNKGDTVWLECTSQTNPFGYMGSFTGNRNALLIDNGKAKIVRTPTYDQKTNREQHNIEISIEANGNAKADVNTVLRGLSYERDGLAFVLNMNNDIQKKWVLENSGFSNFDLNSYQLELVKGDLPEAHIRSSYDLNKYARVSGKRLFFELNPFAESYQLVSKTDSLLKDEFFEVKDGITKIDSVTFRVPENFRFEYLPEPGEVSTSFGSFESQVENETGVVRFIRKVVINKGKYPSSDYETYKSFIKRINQLESPKVVVNKTT